METCLSRKHQGTAWLCTIGRWGWEGEGGAFWACALSLLSGTVCFTKQGLLKPVYTQVLKEGLGPKSELKPMGVTFVCQSLTVPVPLDM